MGFSPEEILETINMINHLHFDIRTVTLGISLLDCGDADPKVTADNIYKKILSTGKKLVPTVKKMERLYGVPIINTRVAVTPISLLNRRFSPEGFLLIAETLDKAADELGIDFIGGFSALVQKGFTNSDRALFSVLPEALSSTNKVCASLNVASTKAGINMDAINLAAAAIKKAAALSARAAGIACAKLVVFANAPEDNPFMAGAFHGIGEAEATINIGISGPGVVRATIQRFPGLDLGALAEEIKKTVFKITRVGELIGRKVSTELELPFGIVDLSLAPTPAPGDSVANILEAMGLEKCGTHGTTAALAMLNDAVKKGGAMASSYVGGLSGAFIPVSEDAGMIEAVEAGALSLTKLEAMTAVCSVGLDMIAVPGDTPVETIAGIIADEMAIGVINNKTTAVRIIPVPGRGVGEKVSFGGLLGEAPIMAVNTYGSQEFVRRGGQIPAPIRALTN
ncbi:MAG TPA: PFL family protein [Firmicutes bacterium]|jgi:uncharacterized protein (UPF0210 family)|nr:PFL family protein [Bacillota bacterium]